MRFVHSQISITIGHVCWLNEASFVVSICQPLILGNSISCCRSCRWTRSRHCWSIERLPSAAEQMALFASSDHTTFARRAWIRQHLVLCSATCCNTHPYHHRIGRILSHGEWSKSILPWKICILSTFLVEIGWDICKMFLYDSFSATTRSKHSPALSTESSHTRLGLRFHSFHHGLEHHSYSSSTHLSTHHSTPCCRSIGHHVNTTAVHDLTSAAREITWQRSRSEYSRIWNEDRIPDVVFAYLHFRQIFVSEVSWWMDIDRYLDFVHYHARVATSQADRRHQCLGSEPNRPISSLQRWSSCRCPICIWPHWSSISYLSLPKNTTRQSIPSSMRCQCHICRKYLDWCPTTPFSPQFLRESFFWWIFLFIIQNQWSRLRFRRHTMCHIDFICGTLCHGPSTNSFNSLLQASISTNWKYGNCVFD